VRRQRENQHLLRFERRWRRSASGWQRCKSWYFGPPFKTAGKSDSYFENLAIRSSCRSGEYDTKVRVLILGLTRTGSVSSFRLVPAWSSPITIRIIPGEKVTFAAIFQNATCCVDYEFPTRTSTKRHSFGNRSRMR